MSSHPLSIKQYRVSCLILAPTQYVRIQFADGVAAGGGVPGLIASLSQGSILQFLGLGPSQLDLSLAKSPTVVDIFGWKFQYFARKVNNISIKGGFMTNESSLFPFLNEKQSNRGLHHRPPRHGDFAILRFPISSLP